MLDRQFYNNHFFFDTYRQFCIGIFRNDKIFYNLCLIQIRCDLFLGLYCCLSLIVISYALGVCGLLFLIVSLDSNLGNFLFATLTGFLGVLFVICISCVLVLYILFQLLRILIGILGQIDFQKSYVIVVMIDFKIVGIVQLCLRFVFQTNNIRCLLIQLILTSKIRAVAVSSCCTTSVSVSRCQVDHNAILNLMSCTHLGGHTNDLIIFI